MKVTPRPTLERQDCLEGDNLFLYHYAAKYVKGKRVLDIGTGYGFGADYVFSKGATQVIGVDIDNNAVQYAKNSFNRKNIKFRRMDATKIRFPKKSFDVIIAFDVIEHFPEKKHNDFLKDIKEILDQQGVLLLSTPNKLINSPDTDIPGNPYHFKEYLPKELLKLVQKNFSNTKLLGMKSINQEFNNEVNRLDSLFRYKFFKIFGRFKVARDMVSFIPKKLRKQISGENRLPVRGIKDFKLEKNNIDESKNLFIIAMKHA